MTIIRHIALNLLQLAKTQRQSIKRLRKMAGWDNNILNLIIHQKLSRSSRAMNRFVIEFEVVVY